MSCPSAGTGESPGPWSAFLRRCRALWPAKVVAQQCAQLGEWNLGAQGVEEFRDVPCDQSALAGEVEAYPVDAVRVVVVEQEVSGELLYC